MSNKHLLVASLLTFGLVAGPAPVLAQSTATRAQPGTPPPASAETATQSFVNNAAISDMYEIQAGKIAESKGQSKAVRALGARMVKAHTQTTAKLKATLNSAKIAVHPPGALDTAHQKLLDDLNGANGADFDKMYLSQQATAHQDALTLMQTYASTGDNPALKKLATGTMPVIRQHIEMIDKLKP